MDMYAWRLPQRLGVIVQMHEGGTRLPGKMLMDLAGRPFCEWALVQIARACDLAEVEFHACVPDGDDRLMGICDGLGIERFPRTGDALDSPHLHCIVERYDRYALLNVCLPFVSVESHKCLIEAAKTCKLPFRTVRRDRGYVWDGTLTRIVGRGEIIDTKINAPYYTQVHWGGGAATWMMRESIEAGKPTPKAGYSLVLLPDTPEFRIDVDTMADLTMARGYAHHLSWENTSPQDLPETAPGGEPVPTCIIGQETAGS